MIAYKPQKHPLSQPFDQGTEPPRKRGIKILWISLAIAAILAGAGYIGFQQYIKSNTHDYYKVLVNGQAVGTIGDPSEVTKLVQAETAEMNEAYPSLKMSLRTGNISFEKISEYKGTADSQATLDKLESSFKMSAEGTEVKVNGEVVGIVKNEETAQAILKQIQNKYAPPSRMKSSFPKVQLLSTGSANQTTAPSNRIAGVKFAEEIEFSQKELDPSKVLGQDQLKELLSGGKDAKTKYTIQQGDCVGCIAQKFNISPEVIYKDNPWIQDDLIKAGDVLELTLAKPVINVVTTEVQTEIITSEPQVIIQKKATLNKGQSKVIQQGKAGRKQLTYTVVKQNGNKMSEDLVSIDVIEKSVPKIVVQGTKVVNSGEGSDESVSGKGSGTFSWPVSGYRITSTYGSRWGRMHKGIDLVGSSSIKAADEGVVEFAGTKNGYGKAVIIDHKNGFKTLYGHMNSLSVKTGEKVGRGEKIGVMGNTGRSTGIHLHFEIFKNGKLQNPLKYL
ncbi:M23 family metallopeptidase [Paenibacillus pasadenensis]|uniref:M23 family metallopeptidase n=1 Tax=Paenibacillus pasadenensis TaxID=217090 RepID=UPI00203EB001|nr:M23 family metallopeptidase [Paenibacillus pasadenensis]MCM3747923.1 M23 family metallopeptidase [Paenibacillus pasadenensis]